MEYSKNSPSSAGGMNCTKMKRTFVRQYDLWYNRISQEG